MLLHPYGPDHLVRPRCEPRNSIRSSRKSARAHCISDSPQRTGRLSEWRFGLLCPAKVPAVPRTEYFRHELRDLDPTGSSQRRNVMQLQNGGTLASGMTQTAGLVPALQGYVRLPVSPLREFVCSKCTALALIQFHFCAIDCAS